MALSNLERCAVPFSVVWCLSVCIFIVLYCPIAPITEPSIASEDGQPRQIFFMIDSGIRVTSRVACAVESASRHHPNWTVYLMRYTRPLFPGSNVFSHALRSLSNVRAKMITIETHFKNSSLTSWLRQRLHHRSYRLRLSDTLSLSILHQHGGIYLDLGVVVLKPMDGLSNCVAVSGVETIEHGVLAFWKSHPFLDECVNNIVSEHTPVEWDGNTADVLRKALFRRCNETSVAHITGKTCGGVMVHSQEKFLPVDQNTWYIFFRKANAEETWKSLRDSYLMFTYYMKSQGVPVEEGSAYEQAAKMHCPLTYNTSKSYYGVF
ncbi:alpha-1,4-N-acetylglucosaminyltransferase-like [Ornithodoros turicata]|uniref:alpha-1,4-N-acetylglucosaminyltransferase-like n=1 Tax=Ornithodoros turicata TaxID=34597 RepID=UPI003139613C